MTITILTFAGKYVTCIVIWGKEQQKLKLFKILRDYNKLAWSRGSYQVGWPWPGFKVTGVLETPMHILFLKILVNNIQELSYGALCLGHVYITKTQGVRSMSVIIHPRYFLTPSTLKWSRTYNPISLVFDLGWHADVISWPCFGNGTQYSTNLLPSAHSTRNVLLNVHASHSRQS